ncbi:hypothetical protein HD592_000665 [Schaalia hyovaginalis]|uniref:Uncharacterized protein n=1 Tax=Schaalia hyovaginalis TaxID=29316 RepID=A0A923IXG4_9ACTO|nr:hypothetical protein [Schaalia hyovaginalis]
MWVECDSYSGCKQCLSCPAPPFVLVRGLGCV